MKKHLKYTTIFSAFALYSLYSMPSYAADKTLAQIIDAIDGDYPGVKIAPTHRGRYRYDNAYAIPGAGENSYSAVALAANANALAVELDVKSTADNYPIASHDYVIGRITSYTNNATSQNVGACAAYYCDFNPYNGIGYNPSVSSTNLTEWARRYARQADGPTTEDNAAIYPNIFQNAVRYGMVPLLDYKNAGDQANVYNVALKGGSEYFSVIEKVPMGSYTPQTFQNIHGSGRTVAVMANGDMNNIIANSPNGDPSAYMAQLKGSDYNLSYFEITVKNDSSGVYDPMYTFYRYAVSNRWTVGSFNPVPEYQSNGFFRSDNGRCCAYDNVAADWSATSRLGTDPLPDLRLDVNWIAARNTVVISDVPARLPIGIW